MTELRVRYRNSVLGFLWNLLNPLLLASVFWLVFSRIGRMDEKSYALFLISGLLVWNFFQQSLGGGIGCILKQKGLFSKVYVPKIVFPVALVTSNLVNTLFFLLAYFVFLLASPKMELTGFVVMIVPVLIMTYMLSLGCTMFFSALNVYFRDLENIVQVGLRAMFYVTPIIYRPSLFEDIETLLMLNPMYYPVTLGRDSLYFGELGTLNDWLIGFGVAGVALIVGYVVFGRLERNFIYYA